MTANLITQLRTTASEIWPTRTADLLDEAAPLIEQLQQAAERHQQTVPDLHATLIALNDLVAVPTDPNTYRHAQQTLRRIREQRHINIDAIRPTRDLTYGT